MIKVLHIDDDVDHHRLTAAQLRRLSADLVLDRVDSREAGAKALKEGVSQAAVGEFIYLLKGSGTGEFYRFNTTSLVWETMASAPNGASGSLAERHVRVKADGRFGAVLECGPDYESLCNHGIIHPVAA